MKKLIIALLLVVGLGSVLLTTTAFTEPVKSEIVDPTAPYDQATISLPSELSIPGNGACIKISNGVSTTVWYGGGIAYFKVCSVATGNCGPQYTTTEHIGRVMCGIQ